MTKDKALSEQISWDWIPHIRVGPLRFGATKKEVQKKFALTNERWDQDKESVTYDIDGLDGYLTFYGDVLTSVCFYEKATSKGVSLIGLTIPELEEVLGFTHDTKDRPVLFDDGSIITHYEFDASEILVGEKDSIVDSCTFSNFNL